MPSHQGLVQLALRTDQQARIEDPAHLGIRRQMVAYRKPQASSALMQRPKGERHDPFGGVAALNSEDGVS